jgi:hypothetical protein
MSFLPLDLNGARLALVDLHALSFGSQESVLDPNGVKAGPQKDRGRGVSPEKLPVDKNAAARVDNERDHGRLGRRRRTRRRRCCGGSRWRRHRIRRGAGAAVSAAAVSAAAAVPRGVTLMRAMGAMRPVGKIGRRVRERLQEERRRPVVLVVGATCRLRGSPLGEEIRRRCRRDHRSHCRSKRHQSRMTCPHSTRWSRGHRLSVNGWSRLCVGRTDESASVSPGERIISGVVVPGVAGPGWPRPRATLTSKAVAGIGEPSGGRVRVPWHRGERQPDRARKGHFSRTARPYRWSSSRRQGPGPMRFRNCDELRLSASLRRARRRR